MNISFESLFYNNFQVEWFFCTKENAVFSLKDLFLVHRKQNLKTLPKITQIKEISAWLVISQDTLLFRFRTTAYSLALQDRLCPFHPNIKIDKNLSGYCQRIWILMNGISVDKDYIFFEYIIPTFKNSINNISNANIFFH